MLRLQAFGTPEPGFVAVFLTAPVPSETTMAPAARVPAKSVPHGSKQRTQSAEIEMTHELLKCIHAYARLL